jgi:hypothetical protein
VPVRFPEVAVAVLGSAVAAVPECDHRLARFVSRLRRSVTQSICLARISRSEIGVGCCRVPPYLDSFPRILLSRNSEGLVFVFTSKGLEL